jgi:hypothetical protein
MRKLDRVIFELRCRGYDFDIQTVEDEDGEVISNYCGVGLGFFFSDSGGGAETIYIIEDPLFYQLKGLAKKTWAYIGRSLENIEIIPDEDFNEKTLIEYVDNIENHYCLGYTIKNLEKVW